MPEHMVEASDLVGVLGPGGAAYVDADWLEPGGAHSIASAIVFDPARGLRWSGGPWLDAGADPDLSAWALIDAHARTVAQDLPAGSVRVLGQGLLAARIRAALEAEVLERPVAASSGVPDVVVDTSARPAGLEEATTIVADLGTVVLTASPVASGGYPFDLYQQVHKRGLRLRGALAVAEAPRLEQALPAFTPPGALQDESKTSSGWFVLRP